MGHSEGSLYTCLFGPGPGSSPWSLNLTQKWAHIPTWEISFPRPGGWVISGLGTWFACFPVRVNVTERTAGRHAPTDVLAPPPSVLC